jgi:hypothetical protein
MLEDYIINEQIRYENHYLKVAQTDIEIGGVTGAALLSALIVDTEEVSAHRQKQLTQYLRIQEKDWDYFRSLSAAIYALRQMGYVRRACSLRDITRWMSEQLVKDYSTKNNHDQFVRAWKDLGRYTPEVKDYVESLKENGVMPLNGIY